MLNLISTLSLASALTLQPTTSSFSYPSINGATNPTITIESDSTIENFCIIANKQFFFGNDEIQSNKGNVNHSATYYNTNDARYWSSSTLQQGYLILADPNTELYKYKDYNDWEIFSEERNIYKVIEVPINKSGTYTYNLRSTTSMEELLTALSTAVQSAVSIFVEGFGGLTQIFYNGTEITFIGGILIVGLAVMFLMMFLRWIVSFVKGI